MHIFFLLGTKGHSRTYYIMLDGCDAMDIQWKDTLELILLVGPFTTWGNQSGELLYYYLFYIKISIEQDIQAP